MKRYGDTVWETSVNTGFASAPIVINGVVYTEVSIRRSAPTPHRGPRSP